MMKKRICLRFTFLALVLLGFAQLVAAGTAQKYVFLKGKLEGLGSALLIARPSVVVRSALPLWADSGQRFQLDVSGDKFALRVPVNAPYVYLQFDVLKRVDLSSTGGLLLSAGDSLDITFSALGLRLKGSGAGSLEFQQRGFALAGSLDHTFIDKSSITEVFSKYKVLLDSLNVSAGSLEQGRISRILLLNARCGLISSLLSRLYPLKFHKDVVLDCLIRKSLADFAPEIKSQQDWNLMRFSPAYSALVLLYQDLLVFFEPGDNSLYFDRLHRQLAAGYSGIWKARLMAELFLTKSEKPGNVEKLLRETIKETRDSLSRSVLLTQLQIKGKGEKALPFVLPDSTGKKVALADFKGKFVVCHFWFRRCAPCMILAKYLHPMIEKFQGDDRIVFLSINVDKDKQDWIAALREGKHTAKNELALFTEGLGFEHTLCKYYQFGGFPQLLIVDQKGNFVSSNATQPRNTELALEFEKYLNGLLARNL